MSLKEWLGRSLVYAVLEIGALCGVPMRPDQIEQLMKITERTAATQVVKNDEGDGTGNGNRKAHGT